MKCSLTINSTWLENNHLGFSGIGLKSAVVFFAKNLSFPFIASCGNNVTPSCQAADSLWDLFLAKHRSN